MGYGIPAAIGNQVAFPNTVICITGDASIQMNIQELGQLRNTSYLSKLFF